MSRIKNGGRINQQYLQTLNLRMRWPSTIVRNLFHILLEDYSSAVQKTLSPCQKARDLDFNNLKKAFSHVCTQLERASIALRSGTSTQKRLSESQRYANILKKLPPNLLLQSISSALAMLLHCDSRNLKSGKTTNLRRPRFTFSTYPNSPGLSKLMADYTGAVLFDTPIPPRCQSITVARKFTANTLNLKILDPSMEGGQLLLGIAESWIQLVLKNHREGSREARRFIQAGLERLCQETLYGIDRNPLAVLAVRTAFRILSESHGLKPLSPKNIETFDSLHKNNLAEFDAVINNPPWGERTTTAERKHIKAHFSTVKSQVDTYIAFVEQSINKLKPGGNYIFALPATAVATAKAKEMRQFLAQQTNVTLMTLLPKQVFADAAIRSVVIAGKKTGNRKAKKKCQILKINGFENLDSSGKYSSELIESEQLQLRGSRSWCDLFLKSKKRLPLQNTTPLSNLATLVGGKPGTKVSFINGQTEHTHGDCDKLFMEVLPFGHFPLLLSRNVKPMTVTSVRFHSIVNPDRKNLLDEILRKRRIVIRRLADSDGRLTAAPVKFSVLPIKGLISVIPHDIDTHLLSAILCSSHVAGWIKHKTYALINPRYKTITLGDVGQIPIPAVISEYSPNIKPEKIVKTAAFKLCGDIVRLAKKLQLTRIANTKRTSILENIDHLVEQLYKNC